VQAENKQTSKKKRKNSKYRKAIQKNNYKKMIQKNNKKSIKKISIKQ